jgi:GNAT superfamily N-acetyltransferase
MDQTEPAWPPAIRRARADDVDDVAELFWTARAESVPDIPMIVHPKESVTPFVRTVLMREFEVWVAECDGSMVGFMALMPPDQLGHLYLRRAYTGRGLGSRFIELAKQRLPDGLQLWTFQSNLGSVRFYERHGFVPVEWTDGNNEEKQPDVRMVWQP